MARSLLAALLLLTLVACGGLNSAEDETIGWSAQKLYGEAKDAMHGARRLGARKVASRAPLIRALARDAE